MNISKGEYEALQDSFSAAHNKFLLEQQEKRAVQAKLDDRKALFEGVRRAAMGIAPFPHTQAQGLAGGNFYGETVASPMPTLSRAERQEREIADLHERIVALECRLSAVIMLVEVAER